MLEVLQSLNRMKINIHERLLAAPKSLSPNDDDRLSFNNLTAALNTLQDESDNAFIYLPEIGNSFFASFSLKTKASQLGRSWLTNPWYAAMGTSIPYARSTCHAIQDRKTSDIPVIITGDGGFHFQSNELIHFLREDLFVILIYMNNKIFHLGKTGDSNIYNCSDDRFDPISLVKAYGGRGWKCSTWKEFKKTFQDACKERKGINLIEIPTGISDAEQSPEIQLLNLYIKSRNGDPASIEAWKKLK